MADTDPDFPITRWKRKSDLLQAAIAYEEAWTAYTQERPRPDHVDNQLRLAKGVAHQDLINAVRALKEYS